MAIRFGDNGAFTWLSGSDEGNLSIVGAITSSVVVEHSYQVSGAISTAAGVTASQGLSASYTSLATLTVGNGNTNSIFMQNGVMATTGYFDITEMSAPGSPSSNVGRLFVADDSGTTKLFFKDSAGTSTNLLAGGSSISQANQGNNRVVTSVDATNINAEANLTFDGSTLTVAGNVTSSTGITGSSFQVNDTIRLNANGNITNVAVLTATTLSASAVSGATGHFDAVYANDGGTNAVTITGDGIVNASQRVTSALGITGSSMLVNGKIHLNANANIGGVSSLSASLGITGSSVRVNDTIHLNANGNITSVHHIYPAADNTYDLGAAGNRWRNIYTGDLHLSNESRGGGNEVDGTWGSYTIQEGENDLFLINKRTGKKLRFVTEEIE
tara:strand:+ start:697 stop:1854 length:1158 start_codon:yes stop_codon:yes gene_type:complete